MTQRKTFEQAIKLDLSSKYETVDYAVHLSDIEIIKVEESLKEEESNKHHIVKRSPDGETDDTQAPKDVEEEAEGKKESKSTEAKSEKKMRKKHIPITEPVTNMVYFDSNNYGQYVFKRGGYDDYDDEYYDDEDGHYNDDAEINQMPQNSKTKKTSKNISKPKNDSDYQFDSPVNDSDDESNKNNANDSENTDHSATEDQPKKLPKQFINDYGFLQLSSVQSSEKDYSDY